MLRYFKENLRLILFLAVVLVWAVLIAVLTHDNWSLYMPWNKAKAVKTAETYLSETYNKPFTVTDVTIHSNGANVFNDFQSPALVYSGAAAEINFTDEADFEAVIVVDNKFNVKYDNYAALNIDNIVNNEIQSYVKELNFQAIRQVDIHFRAGYNSVGNENPVVEIYTSTDDPALITDLFAKKCNYEIHILTGLDSQSSENAIKLTASQLYHVMTFLRKKGFDNGSSYILCNSRVLYLSDFSDTTEEEAVNEMIAEIKKWYEIKL